MEDAMRACVMRPMMRVSVTFSLTSVEAVSSKRVVVMARTWFMD